MPGQQFVDPIDRMIGDVSQDVAQIRLGVNVVELGRFHEGSQALSQVHLD